MGNGKIKIEISNLEVKYDQKEALKGISFDIYENEILAIIGPAQSGKTTLLKVINRTIEFFPDVRVGGTVRIDGENVREMKNVNELRRRIGMVFPLPVGLPLSIYDNVAFAPRAAGIHDREYWLGLALTLVYGALLFALAAQFFVDKDLLWIE